METRECLLGRRSVRKYKSDPIPDNLLEEILECGLAAPSAINLQHWHFVVVRSPEKMAEFIAIMGNVLDQFRPILEERFAKNPETVKETGTFLQTLGGAPVCVLAFFLKEEYPDRDGAMQSVSAAIENVLLAAWDKGYGSCWMTAPQRMGFGPTLGERFAPGKGEFVAAITMGRAELVPQMPARREGRFVFM